jgi:hypothetical protein
VAREAVQQLQRAKGLLAELVDGATTPLPAPRWY